MQKAIKKLMYRLRLVLASVLLLGVQALAPVSAFVPSVSAAPICVNDSAGANDEPGQKDLTKLCVDYANVPTTVETKWNWDELGTSGNNTMDACSLFDTDNDGNINYAVCVTTNNTPATLTSLTTYSCGDTKIDRCTSTSTVISSGTTSCGVGQQNTDPFPAGAANPVDTQGLCTIQLSTIGGASAKLIDVCSYPSAQPNSDPSDCIIARNDFGKVEVIKDIVPNSDTGLFNLTINGPEANDTTTVNNVGDGGTTGEKVVKKGTVVVSETAGTNTVLTNYNTTIVCKDLNGTGTIVGQASSLTGASSRQLSFTLAEDADVVCTITNTRQQATLTLQKTVVNDNGGTLTQSNFPVAINGNAAAWGANTVAPGSYTVSETQQPGYTAGAWGGDCDAQGNVTLTDGQSKNCTITNNDQASKLIVKKVVVNDNGGTKKADDFSFSVNGGQATSFEADGQNDLTVNAGVYDVVEPTVTGYATTYDNCDNVVVSNGETETCTVTNDDIQPKLTVTKVVVNNNGGTAIVSDFPLFVDATGVTSGAQNGFDANSYVVSETQLSGYAGSISGDCDANGNVTLSVGDVKSCTITNNDIAPLLTVIKYVVNNNGGLLNVGDFNLYVDANQVTSGVPNVLDAGAYVVSEDNQPGYTAGSWGGDCDAQGNVTLTVGGAYTCTITNDDQAGKLIVKKVVVNDNGGNETADSFSFVVNGGGAVSFEVDGQNDLTVNAGTYDVTEPAVDGYTTTYDNCDDVVIPNGGTATCTITNDDVAPTVTLIKYVINNSGGTAGSNDFGLTVGGVATDSGDVKSVDANTPVVLNEAGLSGYAFVSITGDNKCPDTLGGTVTLDEGENVTCTITNNDIAASLTLIKYVVNDNGGSLGISDFPLFVDGNQVTSGVPNLFNAGSHTASETNQPGYTAGSWGGDCATDGTITLALGGQYNCTITNNDQAGKLIVKKVLVTDNGGTETVEDFSFSVNGGSTVVFEADGQNDLTVNAGTYSVVEPAVTGYATTYDNCNQITVANGETETCTITNDDIAPKLTLVKTVVNNNGGNAGVVDFPLFINGNQVTSGDANTLAANTLYTASETSQPGYTAGNWGGDCATDGTVTLLPGDDKTCTITNDDQAATVTLIKYVINNDGGTAGVNDFGLSIGGVPTNSGDVKTVDANTPIALNEAGLFGYAFVTISGDNKCPDTLGGTVTLDEGENVTCTIVNNDIAPSLTLIKYVTNDNGGQLGVGDFPLFVGATQVTSGVPNLFNAGSHTASETNQPGYTAGTWGGDCNADGTITLTLAGQFTCTITNDDQAGKLIVKKVVVNDNGGDKTADDFSFVVDSNPAVAFEADGQNDLTVNAGVYDVTEPSVTGYATTYDNCNQITVANGETETCTITNDDIAPKLKLVKYVTNDDGGEAVVSDFPLFVNGNPVTSGVASTLSANTLYTASETNMEGYTASDWYGDCTADGTITLQPGDYKVCKITNDDQTATIKITKVVANNNGGTAEVEDFTLKVNDEVVQSGDTNDFDGNEEYTISEAYLPKGYEQTDLTCVDTTDEVAVSNPFEAKLGHNYECTITNDDIGPKLTIVKKTRPASEQVFNFTSEELDDFSLAGGDSKEFDDLQVGDFTVTEEETDGWFLKKIVCWGDGSFEKHLESNSVTAALEVGDDLTCKFVNEKFSAIDGFKFEDVDMNGEWDEEEEPALEGWTITLVELCEGQEEAVICEDSELNTVTDEDGYYRFDDLKSGYYVVCEEQQDGWIQTHPWWNEDGCHYIELGGEGDEQRANFGNFKKGKVSGVKFNDVNGNGKQDQGEPTLKDWVITLTKKCELVNLQLQSLRDEVVDECEDEVQTNKTDANGAYSFEGLEPGDYTVCETQQTNWTQTFPTANNGCHKFSVEKSGTVVTADFGNKAKPQVLGELVVTGASTTTGLLLGLGLLTAMGATYFATTRRRSHTN